jgi:aspartate kinase
MSRALEIVRSHGITRRTRSLVVLSACAGVTNALIRIGELGLKENAAEALAAIDQLEARHARIARELLTEELAIEQVRNSLHAIWEEVRTLVRGINLLRELTPKSRDQIQSVGERASSTIFHAALQEQIEGAILFDARDYFITTSDYCAARPIMSEIVRRSKKIRSALTKGAVGVTQGFIGKTLSGDVTTIGRGGSDFSAAIFGVAIDAREIQIWTDVAGIMTCDPRLAPEARTIERISFREASELAFFGAKVLHPETIRPAVEKGIPVLVLSSKEPEHTGTLVESDVSGDRAPIAGIAVKRSVILLRIGLLPSTLYPLPSSVLAVSISVDSATYVLSDASALPMLRSASEGRGTFHIETDRSLITLVGPGLRERSGIAGRIFRSLGRTNCELISYGGSESAISLVVSDDSANRIVKRLHKEFFE